MSDERVCRKFKSYSAEQSYLLPPSVQGELCGDHLYFFLGRVVEGLDLSGFEQACAAEGGVLYAPELMLSVWLDKAQCPDLCFLQSAGTDDGTEGVDWKI